MHFSGVSCDFFFFSCQGLFPIYQYKSVTKLPEEAHIFAVFKIEIFNLMNTLTVREELIVLQLPYLPSDKEYLQVKATWIKKKISAGDFLLIFNSTGD